MSLAGSDDLSLQDASKAGESLSELRPVYFRGTIDIKYTLAYEKTMVKERCGFCRMYFHKSTVCFVVPNHRIMELERKWNIKREGRRYASASFLYTTTEVCLFCSQFFADLNGKGDETTTKKEIKENKLEILTALERTDVARGQRAFQSSYVDGKVAEMAVTEPYIVPSKTRREVDPWWEVDMKRPYHIHSVKFKAATAIRQALHIYVFILDRAYGFEDPFLDNMKERVKLQKVFRLHETNEVEYHDVEWELPDKTVGMAVRIQIEGIHVLSVKKCQVFQGDDVVAPPDDLLEITANSYASLRPSTVQEGRKAMQSPEKRKQEILMNSPLNVREKEKLEKLRNFDLSSVNMLSTHIRHRYDAIEHWKQRVVEEARMFSGEEIITMYKIAFKYVADMSFVNKDHQLNEGDLMGAALIQHYPRCDLNEIHQRVRSIVRWIQTRSHMKVLGPLLNSTSFVNVANDPNEHLYQLLSAFKRVDYFWQKKESIEAAINAQKNSGRPPTAQSVMGLGSPHSHTAGMSHSPGTPPPGGAPAAIALTTHPKANITTAGLKLKHEFLGTAGTTVSEARGCSWSQFLMIMCYFCKLQSHLIPQQVYNVEDGKPTQPLPNPNQSSVLNPNSDEASTAAMSFPSNEGKSVSSYSLQTRLRPAALIRARSQKELINDLSASRVLTIEDFPGQHRKDGRKTLLDNVREEHPPLWNSSFAEYRFAHLKKRLSNDQYFPKTLDLNFAQTLIPKRTSSSLQNHLTLGDMNEMIGAAPADTNSLGSDFPSELSSQQDVHNIITPLTPMAGMMRPGISRMASMKSFSGAIAEGGMVRTPGAGMRASMQMSVAPHGALARSPSRGGMRVSMDMSVNNGGSSRPTTQQSLVHASSAAATSLENLIANVQQIVTGTSSAVEKAPALTLKTKASFSAKQQSHSASSPTAREQTPNTPKHDTPHKDLRNAAADHTDNDDFTDFSSDMEDGNGEHHHHHEEEGQSQVVIDFFRVCALCELRLPRSSVEIKVFRKHVVKLRSSWDPKLVSKEIRSLDNTISMYNLVHVCLFCSQFFDPDFEDGIAYPVQHKVEEPQKAEVEAKVKGKGKHAKVTKKAAPPDLLDSTANLAKVIAAPDLKKPFVPYVDSRFLNSDIEVGELFYRPETRESRSRAKRATDIANVYDKKMESLL